MVSLRFIVTAGLICVAIVTEMRCEQPASSRCGLFQYYDEHMDNCGPCREICLHMKRTKTEKQCKTQCSDYLTASTCTYRQYYDDVVKNCAPCSELCDHHEVKRTSEQCSSKCYNYLKAQNCTEEEYFSDTDLSCTPCSQLCSQRDQYGDTIQDCFHKCPKYLEKYPPGHIVEDSNNQPDPGRSSEVRAAPGDDSTSSSSSVHPGIIVTIVIGSVTLLATIGFVIYLAKTRQPAYMHAPSTEAMAGEDVGNPEMEELAIEMEDGVTEPVQPASPSQAYYASGRRQEENHENGVKSGTQECDPNASSAPCFAGPIRESVL